MASKRPASDAGSSTEGPPAKKSSLTRIQPLNLGSIYSLVSVIMSLIFQMAKPGQCRPRSDCSRKSSLISTDCSLSGSTLFAIPKGIFCTLYGKSTLFKFEPRHKKTCLRGLRPVGQRPDMVYLPPQGEFCRR